MRSVAMTQQIALKTRYGLWARDGNRFINVRTVLPGNRMQDIYVYEFDSRIATWKARKQKNQE